MTLDIDKVKGFCMGLENDYFEKAQKLTTVELGHAFTMAVKEKELEIALSMTKRKVSRI